MLGLFLLLDIIWSEPWYCMLTRNGSDRPDGGPIWGENIASPTKPSISTSRKQNLDGNNHPKLVWIPLTKTMAGSKYALVIQWNGCFLNLFNRKWKDHSHAGLSSHTNDNEPTSDHLSVTNHDTATGHVTGPYVYNSIVSLCSSLVWISTAIPP